MTETHCQNLHEYAERLSFLILQKHWWVKLLVLTPGVFWNFSFLFMKLSTRSPHPSGAQHRILVKKLSPIGSIAPWEKYFYQDGTSSTTKSFTNMLKGFRFLLYGKIGGWNLSFWLLRYSGIFRFFGYLGSSPPGRGIDIVAKSGDFSKNQKMCNLENLKNKKWILFQIQFRVW